MVPVKLYIYDMSNGMARAMSSEFLGQQIDGIWHTSVVINDMEWYYGQGILSELPGRTILGPPHQVLDMGKTEVPQELFLEYINELRPSYTVERYHLLDNNCNHFSNTVCEFLTGKKIPAFITDLPADFLTTPLGQQLRPMIESMFGPSRLQ